ncbi:hypothetical protein J9253_00130 [Thiothrix litoralis]|uniref:Long-chain-fatty-acyl-CoA reductase n=1 Tax=Thiothrix litoralis TaxID=2891210 RepID=A0ABX7WV82_9GAMM|nr:acyl-CoA reductase [Thiothrix litoralis]QTR46408.1 hypothetical protein J9253_00130 [Thiothrix litoralis]
MNVNYILPNIIKPEQLADIALLKPFSKEILTFIDQLSLALLRSPIARNEPELTALAFWMRKSNIEKIRLAMQEKIGEAFLTPRGTVFHIAPSNVDTIFIYSWFLSMLVGNRNIVRLSSKESIQTEILIQHLYELVSLPEHKQIAERNILVRYSPNDDITARLSSFCDVRTIWGGDSTVQQIRRTPIPPTAIDIAFANKYSLALIKASKWLDTSPSDKKKLAELFYNDSYWFDQMACSSPRLVLWIGDLESSKLASNDFWSNLKSIIQVKHKRFADADYVNKFVATNNLAITSKINVQATENNDLIRIWLEEPALHIDDHCGSGLFFESCLNTIDNLHPLLKRSIQTVTYAGFTKKEILAFLEKQPPLGIDRIVPFGQALYFSSTWDGFDLLRTFMREITIS